MVASGPYMFEGSDQLDFSVPADEQEPVAGYIPGRSIMMVRNPSWDASTDDLRPAYVDRIEIARSVEWSPTCTTRWRPATSTTCSTPPDGSVPEEYSTDPTSMIGCTSIRSTP